MKRISPTKLIALKSSFQPLPALSHYDPLRVVNQAGPPQDTPSMPPRQTITPSKCGAPHAVQNLQTSNNRQPTVSLYPPKETKTRNEQKQKRAGRETRRLTVTVNPVMLIRTAHIRLADAHRAGPSGGGSGSGKRYTTNGIAAHPGSTMPGSAVSTSTTTAVGVNISSDPLGDADC